MSDEQMDAYSNADDIIQAVMDKAELFSRYKHSEE